MDAEMIKLASSYGIFCVLFCYLLFYILKDSRGREEKYQATIEKNQEIIQESQNVIVKLTEKFDVVDGMKSDIKDIKDRIFK